ncbi:glycosyltransferase family 2 protein [Nonomuraea pusilla]|uniref:Glycosyl transferase family 2 n=1 Tax=Nonomuraea pusilla TaxID=46177 RepID=A0A1H8J437_9ACTN|nr:glycosyltransferase family 2 protein [Nonomuraea pusilla]SEN75512.1 Glycosyl transferase family 2 [Nonomuraea pusilla]
MPDVDAVDGDAQAPLPLDDFALTVVVPCLNEADNIHDTYREIAEALGDRVNLEILFVDDGSSDETLARIRSVADRDDRVSYLSLSRNFGIEAAFSAGYRYARYPWVLHLDADLQFPPAEAKQLIARAAEGYDAVFGIRVDRKDPWPRRAASLVHDWIARRLLGIEIPPKATTFRLVRTEIARRVVDLRLGTPYFLATLPRLTRAWTTVPTAHRPRAHGSSKVTVRGLAKHSLDLFFGFSPRPMAAAVWAGLAGLPVALAAGLTGSSALFGLALAAALLALALMGRALVHLSRGQTRPPLFLVREANVPVEAADLLEGSAARVGGGR